MFSSTLKFTAFILALLLSLNVYAGAAAPATTAATPAPKEVLLQGGLLGALTSGLSNLQTKLNLDQDVLQAWRLRTDRAADEMDTLVDQKVAPSTSSQVIDFLVLSASWIGLFAVLHLIGKFIVKRLSRRRFFGKHPRVLSVLGYLLPFTAPAMASLPITLMVSHQLPSSVSQVLALCLAYATGSGIFSTSLILCFFTLFNSGHKHVAVAILRKNTPRPLFVIGFLAALSDAFINPIVTNAFGGNLTASVSAISGLVATLIFAVLVVRMRRPVAHLIRNRSLHQRLHHRAVQETLRIFSGLWYWPILLMILVSMVHLIGAGQESQQALQSALMTTILLVGTVFVSTMLHHFFHPHDSETARLRPYVELLRNLIYALSRIIMAVAFIELLGRIWGISILEFAAQNSLGRAISDSISSIGLILLVTWLLWVVIDTAILEALKPSVGKRATRQPSTRIKTILPMLRNAVKIVLVVICAITTMANLGINVAPLLAGAGVVGLAIGFGSQQLVQDVITGLFILIEDTIAIGDWVVLDSNHAGTVESLTIRTLRLRDGKGFVHSVPFGQIKAVTNQSRQFAYAFFSVQFTYDTDIDTALGLVRDTGDWISNDLLLKQNLQGPLQVFGVDSMDLNGITLTAQFRTISGGQYTVGRAFNEHLKKLVDGVENVTFAQRYPLAALLPGETGA